MSIKSQYKQKLTKFMNRLNDISFVGQLIFLVIVLLISWSGVRVIQTNYSLQKQIGNLKQQNQLQKLKNEDLALQNKYYQSNQYIDISARQNFSLAAPGEKEVLVPRQVALAYTVNLPSFTATSPLPNKSTQPAYQRNFESWVNFFLHRPRSN